MDFIIKKGKISTFINQVIMSQKKFIEEKNLQVRYKNKDKLESFHFDWRLFSSMLFYQMLCAIRCAQTDSLIKIKIDQDHDEDPLLIVINSKSRNKDPSAKISVNNSKTSSRDQKKLNIMI